MAFAHHHHYVKLEPDSLHHHNHQQQHYYFGGRETSSSPWPSSPPLPDFTTHAGAGAGASRPPSATGFLSSSMNVRRPTPATHNPHKNSFAYLFVVFLQQLIFFSYILVFVI
jgi:hypothetical protein